jgi:opacity protein-like surface antigen
MHTKFFAGLLLVMAFAGAAFAAVVVEKNSRQVPYVEVFDCQGIHSFVFRGPMGTSRRPILVPPQEYWAAQEAGLYSFVLRYHSGNVCSRLVTPEVFARYRVGDEFYASAEWSSDQAQTEDNKTVRPVTHHRQRTAQVRKQGHSSHRIAKHHRQQRSPRLASR